MQTILFGKKTVILLLMAMLMVTAGCSKAKKTPPAPRQEQAQFEFTIVKPENAPANIKDLLEQRKGREFFSLVESGGAAYAVVSRGKNAPAGSAVRITGVNQAAWAGKVKLAQIQVEFIDPSVSGKVSIGVSTVAVAKISFPRLPGGIEFLITRQIEKSTVPSREPEKGENIRITSPKPGDTVQSPLTVTGQARVFEASLQVELKDKNGKSLAAQSVMASEGAPAWGDFSAVLSYEAPDKPVEGYVEAYTLSAKDGSKQDVIQVPVTIK